MSAGNSICQTRQDRRTHELTVTVTAQIKPARGQASPNRSLDWEGLVKAPPPPPAKELLALDGFRGRGILLSSSMWSMHVQEDPADMKKEDMNGDEFVQTASYTCMKFSVNRKVQIKKKNNLK